MVNDYVLRIMVGFTLSFVGAISIASVGDGCAKDLSLSEKEKSTVNYYNLNSGSYSEKTFQTDLSAKWHYFESLIPKGSRILDAGSGSGRDSLHFAQAGYAVEAFDGSAGQAAQAFKNTGIPVRVLTFDQMDYHEQFKGIWAMASLLHVEAQNLNVVFQKVIDALESSGILYATFIYGDKEFIGADGRYFNAFTQESFADFVRQFPELEVLANNVESVIWSNGKEAKSLEITVKKIK